MRYKDLIAMSLRNLWRRKLRSLLTILGVFIGTASVLLMLSIGFGQRRAFMKMATAEGDLNTIRIYSNIDFGPDGEVWGDKNAKHLNEEAIAELSAIPNVREVVPYLSVSVMAKQGAYENYLNIEGVPREHLERLNLPFIEGGLAAEDQFLPIYVGKYILLDFYNPNDRRGGYVDWQELRRQGPKVDLINKEFFIIWDMNSYWASNDPSSGVSKPKRYPAKASGILGKPGDDEWTSYDHTVYAPLEDLKDQLKLVFRGRAWPGQPRRKNGKPTGEIIYNQLEVKTVSYDKTKEVFSAVKDLGYQANSAIEWIDNMEQESKRSQMVLGAIGGVSLIVAAIGIANTMMMSIYERTKEIGVYKVLGCSLHNIRDMFLAEAGFIGLFGGLFGVLFSLLGSFVMNRYGAILGGLGGGMGYMAAETGEISYIPPWIVPCAILFACVIGMISGLMPARRAMQLSALEALRNE
ncbi:MAG: ABC transporter permease [Eubacteriales bacterium]|nr:ABC transporter permease [Eubacteriales bacterium]